MRTVKISDLKARLSAHLQTVQHGEEIIICDRDKPVARIVPYRPGDYSKQELRLVASGVLAPPLKGRGASQPWPKPAGHVPDEVVKRIWRKEREGR